MELIHPEASRTSRSVRWAFRAPILLALAMIGLITVLNIARLLPARSPTNPWEASEVIEAWRSLRGLPVYDLAPDGHATHFYGALVPWVQGQIFRQLGPNNVSGRVLTLASALATITLIVACTRTKGSAFIAVVVWVILFGLNHRSGQYFVENRPDMTALFFATAGVILLGLGLERRRASSVAMGTACLIVGFFFKQPALVFAAVPPVVLALRGRRPGRTDLWLAFAPLAAAFAVVLSLKVFAPAIYHYMIEVPGSYRINWRLAPLRAWEVLLNSPLFLVLVGEWLVADGGSLRKDARMPWVVAVLAVGLPFSAISFAKNGGTANCMLPALLGMISFCALRLPDVLARVERAAATAGARVVIGSFAAALILMTVFPPSRLREYPPHWENQYHRVVRAAAGLPGTVSCPEDPTIPMYAKEYAGRGLFTELDAHAVDGGWPDAIPDGVIDELRGADYVVDIRNYTNEFLLLRFDQYINGDLLRGLGFVPAEGLLPDSPSYRIWRRATGPAAVGSRTAWNTSDGGRPGHLGR